MGIRFGWNRPAFRPRIEADRGTSQVSLSAFGAEASQSAGFVAKAAHFR